MALLPTNKPKEKDITPKVFFIWGQSMSGKTYLARQFPNPVIINTDGNAKKVSTPSVEVYDFETFVKVLNEIEAGNHDFKTIIIDLVDDIRTMLENYVCKKNNVDDVGEIGYGKGYRDVSMTWQKLMVRLNQLPYNVIFISHIKEISEDGNTIERPSLEQKFYNMTMGRCDMSIKCRKVGQTYLQLVESKRDNYTESDVKDKEVLAILKGIKGVFPVASPTPNTVKAVKPLKKAEATE
ncbi:ATP-binding protein [bacterium]|nr:ATP-binding protein [bacterium]